MLLNTLSIALTDPRVRTARNHWLSNRNRKCTCELDFEELFELFLTRASIASIALIAGVSRQAMSLHYNRYFRDLFNGETGMERQIQKLKARVVERDMATAERVPEKFARVVESAERSNCKVRGVLTIDRSGVKKHTVAVDGHKCHYYRSTRAHAPRPTRLYRYCHFDIALKELARAKGYIFHIALDNQPERIFVVPSTVLRRFYGGRVRTTIYVCPFRPRLYRASKSLDLWDYEEAWHLIAA